MIYSFMPRWGRLASITFYLPTVTDDSRSSNRVSTIQQIAQGDGAYDTAGIQPMPLQAFSFTTQHTLSSTFYTASGNGRDYYNGTNIDFTARENALLHLNVAVQEGGEGTLIDKLWNGVVDPVDGSTLTYYSMEAKVNGEIQVHRKQSTADVTINWIVQTGYYTGSNGKPYMAF